MISKLYGFPVERIIQFDHHEAHAASSYYGSPYNQKRSLVLTIDGEGDLLSSTVSIYNGGNVQLVAKTSSAHSLGYLYMEVTSFLGMKRNEDEYKVMGLSPYAREVGVNTLYKKIKHIITFNPKNSLQFRSAFDTHHTRFFLQEQIKNERFDYVAGAFQKLVEDRTSEWVASCIKKYHISTVCMGGGVVQNIKANQKISLLKGVKEVFFCPSAGDESTAIGGCYLAYKMHCASNRIPFIPLALNSLYLGPQSTNKDIKKMIYKKMLHKKYSVTYYPKIERKIAKLLSQNKIVGRVSGRMEWGARALGNRSILANPSNTGMVKEINMRLKKRDFWMPFTPSILESRERDYIHNPKYIASPYMTMAFSITRKGEKDLISAIHPYDNTTRPQIVNKDSNPLYWTIIKEFEKLTGVGAVLNTSFNLHGLPMVLGPEDALYVFERSGLGYMVLENYLIEKKSKDE
jgi:carbamoyltransferase